MDLRKYGFVCHSNLNLSILGCASLADMLINVPNIEIFVKVDVYSC